MLNSVISREGDVNIIYLEGDLDASTANELTKMLLELVNAGMNKIIIDMGGVGYISSNGLRPFIEWLEATTEVKGIRKLVISNLQAFVEKVFNVTEFDMKFPVYENTEIALKMFEN